MARVTEGKNLETGLESDRFQDAPHPRGTHVFIGHAEAEQNLLRAYLAGHLPQAFLIGGAPGIGKATLAWRLARFLLANPEPAVADDTRTDLFVPPTHPVSRQIIAMGHPDLFLLRREWNDKDKKLFTDIRVEDVRRATHMFQQAAGRGGYRVCILDCAEDLNQNSANASAKAHRGASAALAFSYYRATAGPGAGDAAFTLPKNPVEAPGGGGYRRDRGGAWATVVEH